MIIQSKEKSSSTKIDIARQYSMFANLQYIKILNIGVSQPEMYLRILMKIK